jgi:alpha-galactosidase
MATDMLYTFQSGTAVLAFELDGGVCHFLGLSTGETPQLSERGRAAAPFQVTTWGQPYGGSTAFTTQQTLGSTNSQFLGKIEEENRLTLNFRDALNGLAIAVVYERDGKTSAFRTYTKATNSTDSEVVITQLSSASVHGMMSDAVLRTLDHERLFVHLCKNAWEGEGQWTRARLRDHGIYYATTHTNPTAIHLSNIGSMSTSKLLPLLLLEDTKANDTFFFQLETPSSWYIECGWRNLHEEPSGSLYVILDAANERYLGFARTLKPGETYVTETAAIGAVKGGFSEAARELTRYRRSFIYPAPAWPGEVPVFFNDYMNCLWGNPTLENTLPLVDKASEIGAECYVIDAGWFGERARSWSSGLGDWLPSPDRFGDGGLQSVLDYIGKKGLRPGIWLEMEVASGTSAFAAQASEDCFLHRHGKRICDSGRFFLDYRCAAVRKHLLDVVTRLYGMGVRFIKNDYNSCIGQGDDSLGNAACGMQDHLRAFCAFIDDLRRRFPDLILENCSSGAMREDNEMLKHFHLQSVSDVEDYDLMPSVLQGSLLQVLPEQLGVWAYPLSLRFSDRENPGMLMAPETRALLADGENTVFNLVSGMCGSMYLSGRIDAADDFNTQLLREGLACYKGLRSFIRTATPAFPNGLTHIADRHSFVTVMLEAEARALLYVWRLDTEADTLRIPLSRQQQSLTARKLFPTRPELPYDVCREGTDLVVHLPRRYSGRLIELGR